MPLVYSYVELPVENAVTVSDLYLPLTGVFATEVDIKGFQWDKRLLVDAGNIKTQHREYIGGHSVGLKDALQETEWKSGTYSGIAYQKLVARKQLDYETWTPQVEVGTYSVNSDFLRRLYSDYSRLEVFDPASNENGVNALLLDTEALHETVSVVMYRRDSDSVIRSEHNLKFVQDFTGEISGTSRLATRSGGSIVWANVDTRHEEFVIESGKVYTNRDYSRDIGILSGGTVYTDLDASAFPALFESKGQGSETGRYLFTDFFPVVESSVVLYSVSSAGTVTAWTRVNSTNQSAPGSKEFEVFPELGIIKTTGFQAPDLTLKVALNATDTEVKCFLDTQAFLEYPDTGVLVIGSEEIAYSAKERGAFLNCTRGYNSTTAATHSVGDTVQNRKRGDGTLDQLYLGYTAIPRVEYEIVPDALRTTNRTPWLDVSPIVNVETNNVLQIVSQDLALDSLTLETDAESLGGSLYGPVYYGSSVARLTARALDAKSNPLEGIQIQMQILSGGGTLNGEATTLKGVSNTLGETYAFYQAPTANAEVPILSVVHSGADTIFTIEEVPAGVDPKDIYLYQILKHDKTTGSVGLTRTVRAAASTGGSPIGAFYIDLQDGILSNDFLGGYARILGSDSVEYYREISHIGTDTVGNENASRVYFKTYLDPSLLPSGQTVRFFEADFLGTEATEWNASQLNGTRHIVYFWDTGSEHPVTGAAGAYAPLRPDTVTSTTLTYAGRNLPLPAPSDNTNNLGGYALIVPKLVQLQASAIDPMSGRLLTSNVVRLQLQLPPPLVGVDASGTLPVPYGFRFIKQSFNVATGIGGATFFTINPVAENVNQFSSYRSFT